MLESRETEESLKSILGVGGIWSLWTRSLPERAQGGGLQQGESITPHLLRRHGAKLLINFAAEQVSASVIMADSQGSPGASSKLGATLSAAYA